MIETNKLKSRALGWLAKQDLSEAKFRQKLAALEADEQQIELLLTEFISNGWLNESRYCEAFIAARIRKGQGIRRISNDARVQHLDPTTLKTALENAEVDWFELAKQTYQKRFGSEGPIDIKDKAKRLRFMQYRGFSMDEISFAMEQALDE